MKRKMERKSNQTEDYKNIMKLMRRDFGSTMTKSERVMAAKVLMEELKEARMFGEKVIIEGDFTRIEFA